MNTILAVDDEQKNLNAIKRLFSDQDYRLCFASTGKYALKQVEKCSPSLVILDIMMPGDMDGIDVCTRIKQKYENIMVLMLSAKTALEDRMRGYSVLADDYLVKPYDPDELIAKVKILMRLYDAKKELEDLNHNLEITVKKRTAELIARERQAIVGKMVQGIVHNLRGPLAVVLGSAQLMAIKFDKFLLTTGPADVKKRQLVKGIKENNSKTLSGIGKTSELIDSLLLTGGSNTREKNQAVDLNELIQKEYRFLRSEIIMKHEVEVVLTLAENIPLIMCKYTDFSQVFYNIVKNACEAMASSKERQLNISSSCSSTGILISFADTGPGIDPKKLSMIFDPFFSTKAESLETRAGSGLGLFICSRLMAEYQAFISVINLQPTGSKFLIQIPLSNLCKDEFI